MYSIEEAISKRIHSIMFDLNINQNNLAKILNITQPAVSKYLKGRIPPPLILLQLSKLSGKSIEWILTGKTNLVETVNAVAEKSQVYYTEKTLEEKIIHLPDEIRIKLESLVDSLLNENF